MKRLIFFFFLVISFTLKGQYPNGFSFYPTNTSATFYGTLQLNGSAADSLDWIAAFDSSGNCAGASQIIVYNGVAYINLVIYGDDPLTPLVDEGMSGSEDFYLKLWDASFNDIFIYQSDTNVVSFNGWMNTNAAPLPNYNDPNVIYNFIISLGCTDSMAFNYDSLAIVDDGSCVAILGGCTDSTAFNYDLNANTDDGSCMPYIFGCTDPLAFNYDVNANTDDGNCCLINQLIQKGSDINGEGFEDYSGHSVSLSANGKTVAIGALYNNGNGTNSGHVRIYNYNDTSWVQLGQDIDGVASYDYSGSSVSLSSDGGTVAIGAYLNYGNGAYTGHERV